MSKIHCLPVEILLKIFTSISYTGLLAVSRVCRLWRHGLQDDPYLRVQMFKSASLSGELPTFPETDRLSSEYMSDEIKIHPALQKASYCMGEAIETMGFDLKDVNYEPQFSPLIGLEVSRDYATVPAVTDIHIQVTTPHGPGCYYSTSRPPLHIYASNPEGVRVTDVFSSLVRESCLLCDLLYVASDGAFNQPVKDGQKINLSKKAEILGSFKYYTGLRNARREGSRIFAQAITKQLGM